MKSSSNCKVHGYTENVISIQGGWFRCKICSYRYHKEWRKKEGSKLKLHQYYVAHIDEGLRLKKAIAREEKYVKKLNEPFVNCSKHGRVTDVILNKNKNHRLQYRCRLCNREGAQRQRKRKKSLNPR